MEDHSGKKKKLPYPVLMRTVFRSFFIQAGWNYENFQAIGFVYALLPFITYSSREKSEVQEIVQRHLVCFNTNPYLSGMILGGVMRLEEDRVEGKRTPEEIDTFKQDLMGALGALGDSFFWGALRPLAGLVAVLTAFRFETLAPILFLVLYNAVVMWLRISGVRNGYGYGVDFLNYLKEINLQQKIYWMNGLILFSAGALLPLWILQAVPVIGIPFFSLFAILLGLGWLIWKAERREVSLVYQVGALFVLSELFAQFGWIP